MPRVTLVALGVFSLLIATLFIVRQEGIKRLMAYSSVEHMGVIALGVGFGGPLGMAGALYHMLNHSLNKSLMFFGAGQHDAQLRRPRTSPASAWWDAAFPVVGAMWLAGAVAITGAPPFGLFASELTILRAGLQTSAAWASFAMAVLLIVIFIGFLNHFRMHVLRSRRNDGDETHAGDQRLVRGADVAGDGAAAWPRPLVAAGSLELFRADCARAGRRGAGRRGRTMKGATTRMTCGSPNCEDAAQRPAGFGRPHADGLCLCRPTAAERARVALRRHAGRTRNRSKSGAAA